jgi:phosphatidylglycerophosphate synthase
MPSGTSSPGSAAEARVRSAAPPAGEKLGPVFLQVNRFVNRPLASVLVKALVRTRVTPNQVTVTAFCIGLGGAFAFSRGEHLSVVLGAVLAQLSSVVDCADGMLARATGRTSEFGAYLDLVLDRVNEFFLIAGAVLGCFARTASVRLLILGLVTLGLYFLQISVFYLTEAYAGRALKSQKAETRGLLLFLIFVFGTVDRIDLGIYVLLAVSAAVNVAQLYAFLRPRR